jgi:hypothetical protein
MKRTLHTLLGAEPLGTPVNLFPLIDTLYRSNEGRVVELGFGTTTASLKHERMRRTQTCLRKETYHKGGNGLWPPRGNWGIQRRCYQINQA